jgi:hypothetical protein
MKEMFLEKGKHKGIKKTNENKTPNIATFYKTENNHYRNYESYKLK